MPTRINTTHPCLKHAQSEVKRDSPPVRPSPDDHWGRRVADSLAWRATKAYWNAPRADAPRPQDCIDRAQANIGTLLVAATGILYGLALGLCLTVSSPLLSTLAGISLSAAFFAGGFALDRFFTLPARHTFGFSL